MKELLVICSLFISSLLSGGPLADDSFAEAQKLCSKETTKTWNHDRNFCETTQATVDTRNEFDSCREKKTKKARAECMDSFAQTESGVSHGASLSKAKAGENRVDVISAATAIWGAVALIVKAKKSGTVGNNSCHSLTIAATTSIAGFAASTYIRHQVKGDFDDLAKAFSDQSSKSESSDHYQAQVEAFDFLKTEQEKIKEYANYRKKMYIVMTTGYAAAVVAAGFEFFSFGSLTPCSALFSWKNSMEVGITSAVMSSLSAFMSYKMIEAEKEAEENIEKIESVVKLFETDQVQFCPDGRENLRKPKCYCYTDERKRNPLRTKSNTCQAFWAKFDKNFYKKTSDFVATNGKTKKGCVRLDGQFDEKCKCRKFLDEKGENACKKVKFGPQTLSFFGPKNRGGNFADILGGIFDGSTSIGDVDTSSLGNQNAFSKNATDHFIRKINKDLKSQGRPPITLAGQTQGSINKLNTAANRDKFLVDSQAPSARSLLGGSKSSKLAQALKKVESKVGLKKVTYTGKTQRKKRGSGSAKKKKFRYNFESEKGVTIGGFDSPEMMNKKYKYKESQIVKRSDLSLWKVISHRYINSGLKRLFK